jgi:hypothetical protein
MGGGKELGFALNQSIELVLNRSKPGTTTQVKQGAPQKNTCWGGVSATLYLSLELTTEQLAFLGRIPHWIDEITEHSRSLWRCCDVTVKRQLEAVVAWAITFHRIRIYNCFHLFLGKPNRGVGTEGPGRMVVKK